MKYRRPTTSTPATRRARRRAEKTWTRWAFLAICLVVVLGMVVPAAWARPRSSTSRQTVPSTPPPTWTPSAPKEATERPTKPQPPTAAPTTTVPAGEPTQQPVAKPWLGLSAEPLVVQPGASVSILLELQNLGDGSMGNATITLPQHPSLSIEQAQASLGRAEIGMDGIRWVLGPVGAHGVATLQLAAVVGPDVVPDSEILLSAVLVWPGGQLQSNEWRLSLPPALLPAVGD